MRVALFANARAGRGVSAVELEERIEHAGHVIVQRLEAHWSVAPTIVAEADMVVAAGGDGTVAAAARVTAGTQRPLGILPLGTANNIAKSLGTAGTIDDLARGWHSGQRLAIDVGRLRSSLGDHVFLESVGGGLVPAVINSMDAQPLPRDQDVAAKLARANERYRQLASILRAATWTIVIDGVRLEEHLLMIEVLNTEWLGPNLRLSRDVTPRDGVLSVVMIPERQRNELGAFLHAHDAGSTTAYSFSAMHARRLELMPSGDVHVDDTVFAWNALGPVVIDVWPGALTVLV